MCPDGGIKAKREELVFHRLFNFPAFPCLPSLELLLGSILSARKAATRDHSHSGGQRETMADGVWKGSSCLLFLNMEQRAGAQASLALVADTAMFFVPSWPREGALAA